VRLEARTVDDWLEIGSAHGEGVREEEAASRKRLHADGARDGSAGDEFGAHDGKASAGVLGAVEGGAVAGRGVDGVEDGAVGHA
jgi:hypothetical protein